MGLLHIVPLCSAQVTRPHLFKSLITVYSMWVVVIAAGGKEKEDDSEDEDAEGCHSEGKYT